MPMPKELSLRDTKGRFLKGCKMPQEIICKMRGRVAWNKGKRGTINSGSFKKGHGVPSEWREKVSICTKERLKDKNNNPFTHIKFEGEKNPRWKGGVSKSREYLNRKKREYRLRTGETRHPQSFYKGRYKNFPYPPVSKTEKYKKFHRKKYKYLKKNGGELSVETIQYIYEKNIKEYGTLTCYLCLTPIEFGKDHLEHKTPLSRGGTNAENNLDISCQKCNLKKNNKTYEEFLNVCKNTRVV